MIRKSFINTAGNLFRLEFRNCMLLKSCGILIASTLWIFGCSHGGTRSTADDDVTVEIEDERVVSYGPIIVHFGTIHSELELKEEPNKEEYRTAKFEHTTVAVEHENSMLALVSVREDSRTFSLLRTPNDHFQVSVGDLDADFRPDSIIYVTRDSTDQREVRAVDLNVDGQIDMHVVWDLKKDERDHTRIWFEGAWHRQVQSMPDRQIDIDGRLVPIEFDSQVGFVLKDE